MQRTPQPPAPKLCFGLDFDLREQGCLSCPYKLACYESLGRRKGNVTLDRLEFKLVPEAFHMEIETLLTDPELPELERTYILCYRTIFGKNPPDRIGQNKQALLGVIREANSSIRLFMLTLMIAHIRSNEIIANETGTQRETPFTAKKFLFKNALSKFDDYREMCRKEFGTFDLTALDSLLDENFTENDLHKKLLLSEIIAGKTIIGIKIRRGGNFLEPFYAASELSLDPHWLAIEPSFTQVVYASFLEGKRGTPTENRHRFAAGQVIRELKKRKDYAIGLHQARERIIPRAISEVLHKFGYKPTDFEAEAKPVRNMMDFWCDVGRSIQHHKCLKYVTGETPELKL